MLRLTILVGELVKIRSRVFPCLCVGTLIICVKFFLYTVLHNERVVGCSSEGRPINVWGIEISQDNYVMISW